MTGFRSRFRESEERSLGNQGRKSRNSFPFGKFFFFWELEFRVRGK